MKASNESWLRKILRAKALSAGGFLRKAALIALAYGICQVAGLREHTTIISGTTPTPDGSVLVSALLAALYMAAYFAFVLLAPILLLAAGLWAAMNRALQHR